jgi:AhpD family alkylhydroperoxidase
VRRFNKRYYRSPIAFLRDLWAALRQAPVLRQARRKQLVDRAFAEKVMLVVTQVNGCRYCSYAHTRIALRSGVSDDDLAQLLALQLGEFPASEAVALTFAQHWAETAGHPDPLAEQRFREYYGPEKAQALLAYMRMINLANLVGNTFDAFLSLFGRANPAIDGAGQAGQQAPGEHAPAGPPSRN